MQWDGDEVRIRIEVEWCSLGRIHHQVASAPLTND
jgi:hypothetical protein